VTLQLLAIELDEKRGNVDGALARVAAVEAHANRKEAWMARRGDILAEAGRLEEAKAAYRDALETISALPPRARDNGATVDLEASVRRRLAESAAAPQGNSDAR
jgi:predicted negative regulator of RcsB-dependent stress response